MNRHEKGLLTRAAESLNYYCAEANGDMNDSLAEEIEEYLNRRRQTEKDTAILVLDVYRRSDTSKMFTGILRDDYKLDLTLDACQLLWDTLESARRSTDFRRICD